MSSDPSSDWRPAIRALIYGVQFDRDPLDGVDRIVDLVVDRQALGLSRRDYREAIDRALASSEKVSELIPQDHPEESLRRFLQAVQSKISSS